MDRTELLDRFGLTDRVAIVTGGSRGIGRAIAEGFGAMGAKVVVASRKAEACEAVAAELRAQGATAIGVPCHVGDLDDVANLAEVAASELGGIDIVVNNAANALSQPVGSFTPEAWQKSFDVNVRGGAFLVQAALPHLQASPHASVINTVSVGVFTSGQGVAMYVAGKAALLAMTRSMAAELARHAIRVNAIAPGVIDTDMVRNNPPEVQAYMIAGQPMGRMGQPAEIVPAALFLASDASSFVTGSCLTVDGGQTMP